MCMNYAQQSRLEVIDKLKSLFIRANEQGKTLLRSDVINEICLKTGATKSKALDYIQQLILSNFIHVEGDFLAFSETTAKAVQEANSALFQFPAEETKA